MKLKIRSIADAGNLEKERITFRVQAPVDLGSFAILANKYIDGEPMTDIQSGFWFPFQKAVAGEIVILYTKSGINKTTLTESGKTNYFYYWGRSGTIWDDPEISALLLESPEWDFKAPVTSSQSDVI